MVQKTLDFVLQIVLQYLLLKRNFADIQMPTYLKKRGRKFHFQKRIPKAYQKLFSKRFIQIPLKTDSEAIALQRAHSFNLTLEDFWQTLTVTDAEQAQKEFCEAVLKARMHGFQYKSKEELVERASLPDFINRINSAYIVEDHTTKQAILGGVKTPVITLSQVINEFFHYEQANLKSLSENQFRKWRNPRIKAIHNFTSVVGDKPIDSITRKDILNFRAWWVNRIDKNDLSANTANKEFGFLKKIISTTINNYALNMSVEDLFRQLRLKQTEKKTRHPFSNEFIQDIFIGAKHSGLNDEAQLLILAMIDTGARIGELTRP